MNQIFGSLKMVNFLPSKENTISFSLSFSFYIIICNGSNILLSLPLFIYHNTIIVIEKKKKKVVHASLRKKKKLHKKSMTNFFGVGLLCRVLLYSACHDHPK